MSGWVKARILISCESAMPSLSGWMRGRMSLQNIHIPDCESIRNRRKSTRVMIDRTTLPRSRSGLFDLSFFDRQRRAVMKSIFFSSRTCSRSWIASGG